MATLRALVPWLVVGLTAGLMAAAGVFDYTNGGEDLPAWAALLLVTCVVVPGIVGLLIIRQRPTNLVGWILLLGPLPVALMAAAEEYARVGLDGGSALPAQGVAAALSQAWVFLYAWPLAIAFAFPDGRLPSPRWRPAVVAVFTAAGAVAVISVVLEERVAAVGDLPNALHVSGAEVLEPLFWVAWTVLLAGLFVGVAAVIVRYRRSAGVERLQLKWLMWSAGLIPLALAVCGITSLVIDRAEIVVVTVLLAGWLAASISIGIAVTRHGLYEIDRVINRTLVYGALTILLGAGFVAIVLLSGIWLGRGSVVGTAVATLAVALAFRPLRDRVQRIVDRRFARQRYEGLRAIAAFEDAVRHGAQEPEGVEAALARALGDPGLSLWLRLPQSGAYADVDGHVVAAADSDGRARTRVEREGEELAIVEHDPVLRERPDLLRSVLNAATLPIELARLRAEVRVQLAAVEASRERLVEAGDDERRRLERDLHDGAQQRLVGLGVALRRMQRSLPPDARVLGPALDQAVDEVGRAIADLRTIAAGLRPPRLDDGLAAALGDLARSAPLPVSVRVDAEDLPQPIEVAAYYTVCEAITNAVKHASASRVEVEAVRRDGRLLVRVSDDGAGGAAPRGGSGLAGIADRVGAHGGRLRIDSPPGAGTRLEAELPCAS